MLKTQLVDFVLWLIAVAGLYAIWVWYDAKLDWQAYLLASILVLAVSGISLLLKRAGILTPLPAHPARKPGPIIWIAGAVVLAVWMAKILGWA
jgi:hypothetical protein